jgi:hypothetical protein
MSSENSNPEINEIIKLTKQVIDEDMKILHEHIPISESVNINSTILQDKWVFYFHENDNKDWSDSSYIKLGECSTIQEFWILLNPIIKILEIGQIFLMKNDIFPNWEDSQNINGSSLSFLSSNNYINEWQEMCMGVICGNWVEDTYKINGVSCSPKNRGKYLFRLWMRDCVNTAFTNDYKIDLSNMRRKIYKDDPTTTTTTFQKSCIKTLCSP